MALKYLPILLAGLVFKIINLFITTLAWVLPNLHVRVWASILELHFFLALNPFALPVKIFLFDENNNERVDRGKGEEILFKRTHSTS